jgi:hypothetical protein
MTDYPITPPPELRQLWAQQAQRMSPRDPVEWMQHVSEKAAQWGADCELNACCEWLSDETLCESNTHRRLRAARRPKPQSLKEQALAALDDAIMRGDCITISDALPTIRRALEALPDD